MTYDFTKLADNVEAGTQRAHRFWRYQYPSTHNKWIRLLSWTSDMCWWPDETIEGTNPDIGEQGIHGFKTAGDMWESFDHKPEWLLIRAELSGCGVVFGEVDLWGVIWDHEKGYRAQYARPVAFTSAYGPRSDEVVRELRRMFGTATGSRS